MEVNINTWPEIKVGIGRINIYGLSKSTLPLGTGLSQRSDYPCNGINIKIINAAEITVWLVHNAARVAEG